MKNIWYSAYINVFMQFKFWETLILSASTEKLFLKYLFMVWKSERIQSYYLCAFARYQL